MPVSLNAIFKEDLLEDKSWSHLSTDTKKNMRRLQFGKHKGPLVKANKVMCLRHRKVKCSVMVSRKRNRR